MPTVIDIEKKRGDTRRIVFCIKSDGVAVDISGWTEFTLTIDPSKTPADDSENVAQISGTLTDDGTDGRVHFVAVGSIAPGSYFYDAEALDANAERITFAEGKYKVTQDVTK